MTDSEKEFKKQILVTAETIQIDEFARFLQAAEGGAVDLFLGTTRRFTDGKETASLSYEAAEKLASAEISRVISQACKKWPILRCVVVHRTGSVDVGEISVLIGVATPHRNDSFEACRYLIDELKARVPIWKRELFSDGTSDWVTGTAPDV